MPPEKNKTLQFPCPQCVSLLKAPPAAAGRRCRCPRCHYVFVAPKHSRPPPRGETYALHNGDPSPAKSSASIHVTCPVCHTRMSADLDQVGQSIVCPDCGAPTVVPPPAAPTTVQKAAAGPPADDIYQLSIADQPAAAQTPLIRVICPRCETMMYATEDQIGQSLQCPDCTTSVVVPRSATQRPPIDVMADADQCYALADWKGASTTPSSPPSSATRNRSPAAQTRRVPSSRRPMLPRWPFLAGTFSFPFAPSTRPYSSLLALWATCASWMTWESVFLCNEPDVRSVYLGAILSALTCVLTIMLLSYAAACALNIVRDTGDGCETISNWPDVAFLNWIDEPFHLFLAFCASLALGMGLAWLLRRFDQPYDLATPVCLFFCFPFTFLSTVESGSPWGIFSGPVFQTLWQVPRAWATFYLTSAAVVALAGAVLVAASSLDIPGLILFGAPAASVAWLIYFRLLGRLALYCSETPGKRPEPNAFE